MSQVSDYNIANASGASVRSDLNAVFDAIKTLNSGGSDPSNTAAFMPYVDTADNNNLKIRNSDNTGFTTIGPVNTANLGLLPASGGTMTGVLALPNQTAANPSVHFGDSTTGFFRKASNQIGVATSGLEQLFLDQNGVTLNLQNEIRFGDANSSHYIGLKADTTVGTNFTFTLPTADGSNGQFLKTDGSGKLSFGTVSTFSGAASALTGNTLASGVTASSLTSVGTLNSLSVTNNIVVGGTVDGRDIAVDGAKLDTLSVSSTPAVEVARLSSNQTVSNSSYQTKLTLNITPSTSGTALLVQMNGSATSARDSDGSVKQIQVRLNRGSTTLVTYTTTSTSSSQSLNLHFPLKDTSSHGGNQVTYTIEARFTGGGDENPVLRAGTSIVIQEIV